MEGNMGVVRFLAVVLLAVPTGVMAQESSPGLTPSSIHPLRIVIPAEALEMSLDHAPHQSAADGQWQPVDVLPPGEPIIVVLKGGDRMKGAFKDATSEDIVLTDPAGRERRIPKVDVRQVSDERHDSTLNGLLLGAAVGAGWGVMVGYDRRTFECRSGCSIAIGTMLFPPVGALLGWLKDAKTNHVEILYDAP
jgi:hypothetical protein